MRKLLILSNILIMLNIINAQEINKYHPIDQPDADGRIIKGRDGTHHWQTYMVNADLSNYHHASEAAIERFKDLKYGIRIHWGIYSIVNGRES